MTWSKVKPLPGFHEANQPGERVEKISYNQKQYNKLTLPMKQVSLYTYQTRFLGHHALYNQPWHVLPVISKIFKIKLQQIVPSVGKYLSVYLRAWL